MAKTIAVHSYKGGTGKTSVASNLAVILANKGASVCLLDYDFRAPSLQVLFKEKPRYWLNDFLNGKCDVAKAMVDVSQKVGLNGTLFVGFANPSIEKMRDMMAKDRKWESRALQRTLAARKELQEKKNVEYLIFDTSPGAHYSSINALAASDAVSLVLKADDFDLEGTKEMARGLYDALGRKTGVLLNKIPFEQVAKEGGAERFGKKMEAALGMPVLGLIPCFCELMSAGGRVIYALEKPDHTFTRSVYELAEKMKQL